MRIGIEAYPLSSQFFAGISNYVYNIVKQLEIIDTQDEYFLYTRAGFKIPFEYNPRWHVRIIPGFISRSATLWMQIFVRRCLLEDNIDIFWGTEHFLPLSSPGSIKTVLTVHDLVWKHRPGSMTLQNRILHNLYFKKSLRRADSIIVASQSTRRDLINYFNIEPKKIEVIYEATCEAFKVIHNKQFLENIRKRYKLPTKFILYVGTLEPRKNIVNLLKAYSRLKEKDRLPLLIVGGKGWKCREIFSTYERLNLKKFVKFLGYVRQEDLPGIYNMATLFIYPSLYEGFGLPILEAMACGIPVITSNVFSMPEISGDAALLVNPNNIEEIAKSIGKVLNDSSLRNELIQKGLGRVKKFSWKKAAEDMLKIFERK